jgi:hypothetical protein
MHLQAQASNQGTPLDASAPVEEHNIAGVEDPLAQDVLQDRLLHDMLTGWVAIAHLPQDGVDGFPATQGGVGGFLGEWATVHTALSIPTSLSSSAFFSVMLAFT